MIKFTDQAFGTANWFDGIVQTLAYPSGFMTYLAGMSALDTFLSAAYACVPQSTYMNGDRNFIRSFDNIALGRTAESDSLSGTEGSDFIHGGGGDDTILGSLGRDVIDGAEGRDVVDYSQLDVARQFNLVGNVQSTADYVGYVTGTGLLDILQASLFSIEEIVGGSKSDEFRVNTISDTLKRIDGGEHGADGDLLSLTNAVQGVTIDLQGGFLTIGETQVEVDGFERIEGSLYNDSISGNDDDNILYGNEGADILQGFGGDDFIFFDAEDGANVNGGAGRDVAVALGDGGVTVDMAQQELECVIGCDGADAITVGEAESGLFAAGGGGNDTFAVTNGDGFIEGGPRVLWGGDGADTFEFELASYAQGIAVVQIAGLTEEMFASLTIADLGLDGLDLSMFQAIILNPDQQDRFLYNGQVFSSETQITWEDGYNGSASVRSHTSDFIGSVLGAPLSVQGLYQDDYVWERTRQFEWDDMENILSMSKFTGVWDSAGNPVLDVTEYDPLDSADQAEAMEMYNTYGYGGTPDQILVQVDTDPQYNPFWQWNALWVVGGTFSGEALSWNGQLTAGPLADTGISAFDWLLAA